MSFPLCYKHLYLTLSTLQTPLDINQVFTLAHGFIKSCPSTNVALPVKAFPALTLPATATPGSTVTVTYTAASDQGSKQLFVAFITGTGPQYAPIKGGKVTIPKGLIGTVYAVVTNDGSKVADETTVAGPTILMFSFNSAGTVVA